MAIYNAQFGGGFMPVAGGLNALAQGAAEFHGPEATAWRQSREDPSTFWSVQKGDWYDWVPPKIRRRWAAVTNSDYDPAKGPGDGNMPVFFRDKQSEDQPTPEWAQGQEGVSAQGAIQNFFQSLFGQQGPQGAPQGTQGMQGMPQGTLPQGMPPQAGGMPPQLDMLAHQQATSPPPPPQTSQGMPPQPNFAQPQGASSAFGAGMPGELLQGIAPQMDPQSQGAGGLIMQMLMQAMMGQQLPQRQPGMRGQPGTGGPPSSLTHFKQGGEVDKKMKAVNEFAALLNLDRGEVPIVAHEGEYVLRKEAVDSLGKDFLERLNQSGGNLPRMQEGGGIGRAAQDAGQQRMLEQLEDEDLQMMLDNPNRSVFTPEALQQEATRRAEVLSASVGAPHSISSSDVVTDPKDPSVRPSGWQNISDEISRTPAVQYTPQPKDLGGYDVIGDQIVQGITQVLKDMRYDDNTRNVIGGVREHFPQSPPPTLDWTKQQGEQLDPGDLMPAPTPEPGPEPTPRPAPRPDVTPERRPSPVDEGTLPTPATPEPPETVEAPEPDPVEKPVEYFMRAANVAMPLDWEAIGEMKPGEAYAHLQKIANTQAPWHNVPLEALRGGASMPAQHKLFLHLTDVYNTLHGVTSDNVDRLIAKSDADQRVQLTEFAISKLAEEEQYFGELASLASQQATADLAISKLRERELDLTLPYLQQELDARVSLMKAQAANLDANTIGMHGGAPVMESPEDMLQFATNINSLRDRQTAAAQSSTEHALELFEANPSSQAAAEAFHRSHLRYLLLSGIIPPGTPYEEAREAGFMKVRKFRSIHREENYPSQEIYDEVMVNYLGTHDQLFRAADAFTDRSGTAAALFMGLPSTGIDYNSFLTPPTGTPPAGTP